MVGILDRHINRVSAVSTLFCAQYFKGKSA
jgi:hypothetical protein